MLLTSEQEKDFEKFRKRFWDGVAAVLWPLLTWGLWYGTVVWGYKAIYRDSPGHVGFLAVAWAWAGSMVSVGMTLGWLFSFGGGNYWNGKVTDFIGETIHKGLLAMWQRSTRTRVVPSVVPPRGAWADPEAQEKVGRQPCPNCGCRYCMCAAQREP